MRSNSLNLRISRPRGKKIRQYGIAPSVGGGTFENPVDTVGLSLWLKADAITGLVDNDPVATWNDSSGGANDATQGIASNRPIYKVNIVNGHPVVRFDAVNDGMSTPNAVFGSAPMAVFAVMSFGLTATNRRAVQGLGGPGGNWFMRASSADAYQVFNGAAITDGAISAGAFVLYSFIINGVSGNDFYINGSLIGSNVQNSNFPGRIALGISGDINTEPANCDITEVMAYTANKAATRLAIENYLRTKYGI